MWSCDNSKPPIAARRTGSSPMGEYWSHRGYPKVLGHRAHNCIYFDTRDLSIFIAIRVSVREGTNGVGPATERDTGTLRNDMKLGLQISSFTWPGGTAAIGPTLAGIVRTGRRRRLRFDLGHGPFLPDPGRRPAEEPMLEGWTTLGFMAAHTQARPPRPDGRWRPLPLPGPVGEGRDDARRAVRRPGLARHRRRLERGRVARPRVPVPAARRAVRDARGDAPDRARDVGGRARQRGRASTAGCSTRSGCSTPRSRCHAPGSRS